MKRKLTIAGIVIGAILGLAPFFGLIGTIYGLQRAFSVLGTSGVSDPHALSGSIHTVLYFQTFGLVACPIGIALCIVCIIKLCAINRQPPPLPHSPAQEPLDLKA